MNDIAKEAGVSACTVSRALNRRDGSKVSEEKKAHILEIAKRLEYRPSIMARGLALNRTNLIGVVLSDIDSSLMPEIMQSIQDEANAQGYGVLFYTNHGNPDVEARHLNLIYEKRLDGLLWVPGSPQCITIAEKISRELPVLQMLTTLEEQEFPYIVVDHEKGAYMATKHLIEIGRRRLVHLSNGVILAGKRRIRGFQRALEEYGLSSHDELIAESGFSWQDGYREMKRLLGEGFRPHGVFACSDMNAWGAMTALLEAGLRVPDDTAVVGFDGLKTTSLFEVPLTTVAQPTVRLGKLAMQKLHQRIQGKRVRSIMLEPSLVVRASTVGGPFKRGDGIFKQQFL